ncbi:hypothetical protein [Saccharothrix coeruleofusca]|uniref:Uncharacterized protein n=1 Tax=Saccharothrix coeruleofusca TaxID=33919 RepID=A0A918AM29_9PSEU|nr:hypothetical protein [Saccharothrix coeruleofusca]MBP2336215.1 hypothetical protein [Saccharothrix coeruleofusca]GGP54571.1 hypothetical protein GCM10010185_28850 [Saccharothrix coeruleofusca]
MHSQFSSRPGADLFGHPDAQQSQTSARQSGEPSEQDLVLGPLANPKRTRLN